jgi:hypothetical protein
MDVKTTKTENNSHYVFKGGNNGTIKPVSNSKIDAGIWSYEKLYSSHNPLLECLGGIADLERIKTKGLIINDDSSLFYCLCFLYLYIQEKNKEGINADKVWKFIISFSEMKGLDRTSVNHSLNSLVAVGILAMQKKGLRSINYFLDNGFINNGGFLWFFVEENRRQVKPEFDLFDSFQTKGVLEESRLRIGLINRAIKQTLKLI